MEQIQYLSDFDRCLSLMNRSKEIDRQINQMIGKHTSLSYLLDLQLEKDKLRASIDAIYTQYNN